MTEFPDRAGNAVESDPREAVVRQVVASIGPTWLPRQRWFGDKSRGIVETSVRDLAFASAGEEQYAFAFVDVIFTDEGRSHYLVTLAMAPDDGSSSEALARFESNGVRYTVTEAMESPRFRAWLLDQLVDEAVIQSTQGAIAFAQTSALADYLAAGRSGPSRVIRTEQSNSSVIYGDAIILKLFRKMQPGINPDIEIGQFLTERTPFANAPSLLGYSIKTTHSGDNWSIGMFQSFVANIGDAWTNTLDALREIVARHEAQGDADIAFGLDYNTEFAERLGRRTAQLHVALASHDDDPAFAPEPVTPEIIAEWERATIAAAYETQAMLDRALPTLPAPQQRLVADVDLDPENLSAQIGGYTTLAGTYRIRVHGDYHLGQILQTVANDAVILDFEGEPSRPIDERRRKTSAMKDVAGMLRSFRYARGATMKAYDGDAPLDLVDGWLTDWEMAFRAAFLFGYREKISAAQVPLVPEDDADFSAALVAWELDKALYEIGYEANNRPTWLDIPLSTIIAS